MNTTAKLQWVGIDVSKATLDIHVQPSGAQWQMANRQAQFDALAEQLAALAPRADRAGSQRWLRSRGGGGAG